MLPIQNRQQLIALALALGARKVRGWSCEEERAAKAAAKLGPIDTETVAAALTAIQKGEDPLGTLFCKISPAEERRPQGAVYTPQPIVVEMLRWALNQSAPARVVDPGTGSGRFLVAAGRMTTNSLLVGVEYDPTAAILARAHIAAAGLADRTHIVRGDYRAARLPATKGKTLFAGNPPYVRHHLIQQTWKQWLVATAQKHGFEASQLAGLHVYFFLATAEFAKPGDLGVFITAAEWLDVNYGSLVRELLIHELGLKNLHVVEPTAAPFPGTATTAVITGFEVHTQPQTIAVRRVDDLSGLDSLKTDWHIRRERLENAHRWSPLTRPTADRRRDFIELGEICRVHRGQVTGANRVWIAGAHSTGLPASTLFRSVTKARELIVAGGSLTDATTLRFVIDIPADLDLFDPNERRQIEKFFEYAIAHGADKGYVATHRRAWWSVGLREPAPILATYMARRPPAFVRNLVDARHINIAHGLYPCEPLSVQALDTLARFLSRSVTVSEGRTYAGGLTKFEPREMESLMIPRPEVLEQNIDYETLMA